MRCHPFYIAKTILVKNGDVMQAMGILNRILTNERVFEVYRRAQRYEKPWQTRQRVNYEICRSIYNEDMDRKIAFVMRKNRADPWPGHS